jgi:hypothetical protein
MLTLLFRYERMSAQDDAYSKFNAVVCTWGRLKKSDKLGEIFNGCVGMTSPIVSQRNTEFEIRLSGLDETWVPSDISSKDLAMALGLDPSEWTVWRLL